MKGKGIERERKKIKDNHGQRKTEGEKRKKREKEGDRLTKVDIKK